MILFWKKIYFVIEFNDSYNQVIMVLAQNIHHLACQC